jgi:hypothetical protein
MTLFAHVYLIRERERERERIMMMALNKEDTTSKFTYKYLKPSHPNTLFVISLNILYLFDRTKMLYRKR